MNPITRENLKMMSMTIGGHGAMARRDEEIFMDQFDEQSFKEGLLECFDCPNRDMCFAENGLIVEEHVYEGAEADMVNAGLRSLCDCIDEIDNEAEAAKRAKVDAFFKLIESEWLNDE